jgi:hypothetical protein
MRPRVALALDVGDARGKAEVARIFGDEPARDVDLLELRAHRGQRGEVARDVDRPELHAHAALAQPRNIRLVQSSARDVIGVDISRRLSGAADDDREVVMPVDQWARSKDRLRVAQRGVVRLRVQRRHARKGGGEHDSEPCRVHVSGCLALVLPAASARRKSAERPRASNYPFGPKMT